jgi:hypothetical protein
MMAYPISPYVDERDGGLYVAGTRVSLDSAVIRFQQGASQERFVQSFPPSGFPRCMASSRTTWKTRKQSKPKSLTASVSSNEPRIG